MPPSPICKGGSGTIPASTHILVRIMKGGIHLSATGILRVNAYTSYARIPLENVAITVTAADGTALAMRLTDRSGGIDPIEIPVPEKSAGTQPDTGVTPFTSVDLYARLEGYEQIESARLQLFPDTVTSQDLELIPLPELPPSRAKAEVFDTPPQNL